MLSGEIGPSGNKVDTMTPIELGRGDDAPTNTNRIGIISDCASGMVVQVASLVGTTAHMPGSQKIDFTRCSHASRIGSTCFYWPSTMFMPIRVVQYYVGENGTAAQPDRRLFVRKRIMTSAGISWNAPRALVDGVRDLRVASVGLDDAAPLPPRWRVTRVVGEPASTTAVAALPAAEWARVIRFDIRLSMQSDRQVGIEARRVLRNFETSFSVRGRAAPEPTS
ncbi:MAG: hypothetical protein R3E48_17590 [Burkholderiaceae bacterium]